MPAGFLLLSANTPWVFALGDALSVSRPATAMRFYDFLTWRRERPRWPEGASTSLRRVLRVMPPGYAGRFQTMFAPALRAMIDAERTRLRRASGGEEPFVIAPYPYLEPWLANVPDDRLIYYSLDEYAFYALDRTAQTHAQEDRLVARARRTICLSTYQADVLRRRNPSRAADILHFPLGVERAFLNPAPEAPPEPGTIGYVGNLTDRVDWPFVRAVAEAAPALTFNIVGSLTWLADGVGDQQPPDWKQARDAALALPNVHHLGAVPQAEVAPFYWRSAVNWMPYDTAHGFNRASCPTKIMDAIAAGRPFASTSVPEAMLYPEMIRIADDPAEMARVLAHLVAYPAPPAADMIAFARARTWDHRAAELLTML
ncbi:glycosyltransferase family protein [Sphingomonas immobilis]|uniref:Glycosyltransferase n=1 Tax=Sphingomonas immobilis TaxID=3063997 RepID=A0ABT8ZTM4_9SPHN|nr:glycosyltransferase [Sphingomonas sp. CA1-15]MDO7840915.1 glycosyltransferase [Sphingomonas sp. CA1-15]